jgi:hypothetical protein
MGSVASAAQMVEAVAAAGVDEVACLIDFGLPMKTIMDNLENLSRIMHSNLSSHE